jgi:hypothetical protein
MALVLKDRVKQTAAAPGTGTITLSGSATGFQSFSVIGNGNTTYFAIYDPVSGDWEVNYGTYTSSGTTLTRNATPLSSSAGGSLVNFTGVVDVFVTYPSENAVWRDTAGVVVQQDFGAITATSAALTTGTISTAPVNNTDIVNKAYADAIASGIHFHEAVDLATTAALPANTYNNGTSGVGATLTANANGALSVDSTLTVAANRILVKNEVTQANNGVYTVTQVGSAGTPYILTRAADFDSAGTGVDQIDEGDFFLVTSGVVNLNTAWVQQTAPPIVVGTTALVFQQFAAPITYTAGTGLNESPTYTFNIATTGVSAATYGSASTSATIAVNAQGQITSASNTTIAINGTQVSGNIAGQAGSVANALTLGTYLTGTSYNGSAAVTATVDATDANTASKVVARDSSGNFSAGTITATLSGAATSAGTATNIAGGAANQIPYQTGAATTSFVVAPTVAGTYLNWNGSSFAYTAISLPNNATFNNGGAGDASGTTFNGSAARTISYNTVGASPLAGSSSLTTTGTVTSGTWSASFGAVSGANLTSLTAGNLSGTIPSAVLGNSTAYVGTTAVALNRSSANQALTGITSVTLPGSTSGSAQITPNAVAGTGTVLTLPATTGTLALTSDVPTVNNATLTMNTSGTGLSGSQTFTANQATGATFTVTSNATNANTASTIVARDASGNFSAGTITATLTGQASSVANSLTAGTYLSGTAYNGSAAQTWSVDATSANTASKVVARDASGNFSAGTITATLSGSATSAGTATTASGLTGTPNITVGTITAGDITTYRSGAPTTGYIYWGNTGTKYMGFDGSNIVASVSPSFSITGNAANVTGTVAVANGGTGQTTGYKLFDATFTSNINANTDRTAGMYGSYASAATNAPTTSGILYNFMSGTGGAGDGGQFWQDYANNNLYLRQRWGGGFSSWLTILSASNYNSYAPTLTGSGASGTWGISITGNSATVGGFTPSATSGVGSRVVVSHPAGYIFNNYFNSTDNAITSGVTAIMAKQGDDYYRSASAAAVATFISGQSFNTTGTATGLNGSNYITSTGSSGNYNTDFQNTPAYTYRYNGDSAGITNNPGGTWWFVENMRHSNSGNYWGTQIAWGWEDNANRLATRNVSGGSFGGWVYYLNSSNYTSYAPSLTGSGASGTWGISISGNAATATNVGGLVANSYSTYGGSATTTGRGGYYGLLLGNSSANLNLMSDGTNGGIYRESTGTWAYYYFAANNSLGIMNSTTSASYALYVTGSIYATANVTAYSDRRAKKNIVTIDNALDKTNQLRGVYYEAIEEQVHDTAHHGKRLMGVIAQEVLEVVPEVVTYDKENDKYGVSYANMVGLLIEAVKELSDKVTEQEARIARLETLVNQLIGD